MSGRPLWSDTAVRSGDEPVGQPKTGRPRHSSLRCTSICRARSSCEQAPAYYTSMRPSANQRETARAGRWHQTSSRAGAARQATHMKTKAIGSQWPGITISRGPSGPRQQWTAAHRQQPGVTTIGSTLEAVAKHGGRATTACNRLGDQGPDGLWATYPPVLQDVMARKLEGAGHGRASTFTSGGQ